jgi:hypothetical protein
MENMSHREEILTLTEVTYDAIEVKEAAVNVATNIAKEGTLKCKGIKDLILKTIEKSQRAKNSSSDRNSNNSIIKQSSKH